MGFKGLKKAFSNTKLVAIFGIIGALALIFGAIFFFIKPFAPNPEASPAEISDPTPTEQFELQAIDLIKNIGKHYKSGDYSSIESDIESVLSKYDEPFYKLKMASNAEDFLVKKQDWASLVKLYERMDGICKSATDLDEEIITYISERLTEAKAHV